MDRPITLSSSLVAVCCSSATRSSLLRVSSSVNRRTFSMAMTAWSAKVSRSCDLLVGEGARPPASDQDRAESHAFTQQRGGQRRAVMDLSLRGLRDWILRVRFRRQVVNVDGPPIDDRASGHRPAVDRLAAWWAARRSGRERRDQQDGLVLYLEDVGVGRATQRGRILDDRVEDRLESVGELEITRRISAVAVCCSRASVRSAFLACSSVSNRAFSMAMAAWSAKVVTSSTCLSVKGWTSGAGLRSRRSRRPHASIGTARIVRCIPSWPR